MIGFFNKNSEISKLRAYAAKVGAFNTKASAFDYFFITEGLDVEEADKLATAIIEARGVTEVPAQKGNFDKAKIVIQQITEISKEYPKITEFVVGLISGAATSLIGVAVGNKVNENNSENNTKYEIDNTTEPLEIGEHNSNEIKEIEDEITPV